MAVLDGAGFRRAEVVTLGLSDYDPEKGELIVRGKGNKERTAYIDDGAAEAMEVWVAVRGDALARCLPGDPDRRGAHPGDDRPGCLRHPSLSGGEGEGPSVFTP